MKSNREGKFNMGLLIPKWESTILWALSAVTIEGKKGDGVYLRHMYFMWSLYIHLFNTNLLSSYYVTITDYRHLGTVMNNTGKLLAPRMGFII